jgi:hypothetical protein
MVLKVFWDGLLRLSFELSQFHGHGSWLVCEVALRATSHGVPRPARVSESPLLSLHKTIII